jgi:hypothetical protein
MIVGAPTNVSKSTSKKMSLTIGSQKWHHNIKKSKMASWYKEVKNGIMVYLLRLIKCCQMPMIVGTFSNFSGSTHEN